MASPISSRCSATSLDVSRSSRSYVSLCSASSLRFMPLVPAVFISVALFPTRRVRIFGTARCTAVDSGLQIGIVSNDTIGWKLLSRCFDDKSIRMIDNYSLTMADALMSGAFFSHVHGIKRFTTSSAAHRSINPIRN